MTDTVNRTIAPGWYPDPTPSTAQAARSARWWDGERWTEHTRPVPQTVPAIPVPPWAVAQHAVSAASAGAAPLAVSDGAASVSAASVGAASVSAEPQAWASPTTASSWILAALPLPGLLLTGTAAVLLGSAVGSAGTAVATAGPVLFWLVSLLLAVADRRALRDRGVLAAASPGWMLLVPPVVYLAVRASRVRAAGRRAVGPVVLGAVSTALCLVLVGAGAAAGASRAVAVLQASGSAYGAYDATGAVRPGLVPSRDDVAAFVETTEMLKHGSDLRVNCGFGPIIVGATVRCASRSYGAFTPLAQTVLVTLQDYRILGYSATALDAAAPPRTGTPASRAGGAPSMELIVPTVASGPVGPDGVEAAPGPLTIGAVDAFAAANLHAAGIDWAPTPLANPATVFTTNGSDDGPWLDASGVAWEVDIHVDFTNGRYRVWVYAETA